MSDQKCSIQPNPDIAGVGVRVSIYAQAILSAALPIISSLDGKLDATEMQSLHTMYTGILLTGCALLFSAVIQKATRGLSMYHALIVLNLSWINNIGTITFFVFSICRYLLEQDPRGDFKKLKREIKRISSSQSTFGRFFFIIVCFLWYMPFWPILLAPKAMKGALGSFKARGIAVLIMFHTTFIGMFGYWLKVSGGNDQANCLSFIRLAVLPGVAMPINQNSVLVLMAILHVFALYLPFQAVFLIIFLLPTILLLTLPVYIFDKFRPLRGVKETWARRLYLSGALGCLIYQIFIIVSTELTIIENKSLVANGSDSSESDWTFGQTLAVIMIVVPLVEVGKFLREKFGKKLWEKFRKKFREKMHWGARAEEPQGDQHFELTPVTHSKALVLQYSAEEVLEYYIIDSGSPQGSATPVGSTEVNALLEQILNRGDLRSNNESRRSGDSERGSLIR